MYDAARLKGLCLVIMQHAESGSAAQSITLVCSCSERRTMPRHLVEASSFLSDLVCTDENEVSQLTAMNVPIEARDIDACCKCNLFRRRAAVCMRRACGSDHKLHTAWSRAPLTTLAGAIRAADFLAVERVLADACAEVAGRLNADIDMRISDQQVRTLPVACLQRIASQLDRDTASEAASVWNVVGALPVAAVPPGGMRVCERCARGAASVMDRLVRNARDACIASQVECGQVMDLSDLYPPVAVIIDESVQGLAGAAASSDAIDDDIDEWTLDGMSLDTEDLDSSSDTATEEWISALGLAAGEPEQYLYNNHDTLVQHDAWGHELQHVWRQQMRAYERSHFAAPAAPALLSACLTKAVGRLVANVLDGSQSVQDTRDHGLRCCMCPLGEEQHATVGRELEQAVSRLVVTCAARRAEIELMGHPAANAGFVPFTRQGRARLRDLEARWTADSADADHICDVLHVCTGCGGESGNCDDRLCCTASVGLTRRTLLQQAPRVRYVCEGVRKEYADRLSRHVPPPARLPRRRRSRMRARDTRQKCLVCRNVLPSSSPPAPGQSSSAPSRLTLQTGQTPQYSRPPACGMCVRCCRKASCARHFPHEDVVIYDRFSRTHPASLVAFV